MMTRDEAEVIFKYHIPCVYAGKIDKDMEKLWGKEFRISQITDFYNSEMKTFETSVCLEEDRRCCYTDLIQRVDCHDGYRNFINTKIKEEKKEKLKALIVPLVDNFKTKKDIYAFIGKLIDEIKAERKEVSDE